MKKFTVLLLAIVLVFSLSACGGKDDKAKEKDTGAVTADADKDADADKEDKEEATKGEVYDYVEVVLPDGWVYNDDGNNEVEFQETGTDRKIQFSRSTGPAKDNFDRSIEFWADTDKKREDLGEKTFGQYTYMAQGFEWNKVQSMSLYLDHPVDDGVTLVVDCFEINPDDPIIPEFLETVNIVERK